MPYDASLVDESLRGKVSGKGVAQYHLNGKLSIGSQEACLLEICLTTNTVRETQSREPERRALKLSFVCRDVHQLEAK